VLALVFGRWCLGRMVAAGAARGPAMAQQSRWNFRRRFVSAKYQQHGRNSGWNASVEPENMLSWLGGAGGGIFRGTINSPLSVYTYTFGPRVGG